MNNILRFASLELQTLDKKEVVKVAGVVRRVKNFLHQLFDKGYSEAVDQLHYDSVDLRNAAADLQQAIENLLLAIKEGDLNDYENYLVTVKELTSKLQIALGELNKDFKEAKEVISDDPNYIKYYNKEMLEKNPTEVWKQLEKQLPENHDVKFGKQNTPLKSFKWFQQFGPNDIELYQGAKQNTTANNFATAIINIINKKTNLSENLNEEGILKLVQDHWGELLNKLKQAILDGILLDYRPATPSKEVANRVAGQMKMEVSTAPFVLIPGITAKAIVILTDLTPVDPNNKKLTINMIRGLDTVSGGISPELLVKPGIINKASSDKNLEGVDHIHKKLYEDLDEAVSNNDWMLVGKIYGELDRIDNQIVDGVESIRLHNFLESEKVKVPRHRWLDYTIGYGIGAKLSREKADEDFERTRHFLHYFKRKERISSRVDQLNKLAGVNLDAGKQLSSEFWSKFVNLSSRIGAKPEDLASVIYSESAFDPHATNVQGGRIIAKGLNQLIQPTALSLGMSKSEWDNYENEDAISQLKWVEKYFKNIGSASGIKEWSSPTQLYVANFAPKYVHKAADPNAVLYQSHKDDGSKNPAYFQNKALDMEGKGAITAGDLARYSTRKLPDYILQSINNVKSQTNGISQEPSESIEQMLNYLLNAGIVEKMIKNSFLPQSDVLITLSSTSSYSLRLKFAKSILYVLKDIIDAESSIHTDGNKIEIQCKASGSLYNVSSAILGLTDCIAEELKLKTGTNIIYNILPGIISKYSRMEN